MKTHFKKMVAYLIATLMVLSLVVTFDKPIKTEASAPVATTITIDCGFPELDKPLPSSGNIVSVECGGKKISTNYRLPAIVWCAIDMKDHYVSSESDPVMQKGTKGYMYQFNMTGMYGIIRTLMNGDYDIDTDTVILLTDGKNTYSMYSFGYLGVESVSDIYYTIKDFVAGGTSDGRVTVSFPKEYNIPDLEWKVEWKEYGSLITTDVFEAGKYYKDTIISNADGSPTTYLGKYLAEYDLCVNEKTNYYINGKFLEAEDLYKPFHCPDGYIVTFETNGGSDIEQQTLTYGKKAQKPADPVKADDDSFTYTFAGWFADEDLKTAYNFDTVVDKDITIYAKWDKTEKTNGNGSGNNNGNNNGDNDGNKDGNGSGNDEKTVTYSNEWINGKWYDADGKQTYEPMGEWKSDATGWWYEDSKGWYPKNEWLKIDGIWYFFAPSGYMASEEYYNGYWFNKNGSWDSQYFLTWKSNATGWWVEDISGWWPASRWLKIDGCWYYFNAEGYMVTSQYIDGYWINAEGVCE